MGSGLTKRAGSATLHGMNIAIASYSFHGLVGNKTMDVFGYLEACRHRYDLRSADIWNGMIPNLEKGFLAQLREGLRERELELANLCVDGPHLWEDDAAVRDEHHRGALAWLKAAEYLGARTIRIDAGVRAKTFSKVQFDYIVKRYREYAKIAHNAGFRVGPENHWGAEVEPANMRRICEAVNHPGFGVLLHFKGAGEAQFAKWAMHTHISWDIVTGDLGKSLAMLRDKAYRGYWSVEHHSGKREYSEVAIQVAKVRDVVAGWAEKG